MTSYFTIDEVVVEQKWTRDEDYYLSVYALYPDSEEEEILDENGDIVIEKVLAVDRVVRDYCFIERIDND